MNSIHFGQSALSLFVSALFIAGGTTTELSAQCVPAISMNFNKTQNKLWSSGISKVAIQANSGAQTRLICSVELYMCARLSPATMNVSIYDAKGPQGGGKVLATGSVAVSLKTQIYRVYFSPSAIVPKNQTFWIVFSDSRNFYWPVATSGTTVPQYRFLRKTWSLVNKWPWAYRISSGKATKAVYASYGAGCPAKKSPLLSSSSRPILGSNFSMNLSNAKQNCPVIFILGVSDKVWSQVIPLPFDLTVLGAPGCFLRSSTELLHPTTTDKLGKSSVVMPIPNQAKLNGRLFYSQFLVVDLSSKALTLSISNGGKATIGIF